MANKEPWGNHYHKNKYEYFYVLDGEVDVYIKRVNAVASVTTRFVEGEVFVVEPMDIHTITNAASFSKLLVGYSKAFDSRNPDLHKEDAMPNNPTLK